MYGVSKKQDDREKSIEEEWAGYSILYGGVIN